MSSLSRWDHDELKGDMLPVIFMGHLSEMGHLYVSDKTACVYMSERETVRRRGAIVRLR